MLFKQNVTTVFMVFSKNQKQGKLEWCGLGMLVPMNQMVAFLEACGISPSLDGFLLSVQTKSHSTGLDQAVLQAPGATYTCAQTCPISHVPSKGVVRQYSLCSYGQRSMSCRITPFPVCLECVMWDMFVHMCKRCWVQSSSGV